MTARPSITIPNDRERLVQNPHRLGYSSSIPIPSSSSSITQNNVTRSPDEASSPRPPLKSALSKRSSHRVPPPLIEPELLTAAAPMTQHSTTPSTPPRRRSSPGIAPPANKAPTSPLESGSSNNYGSESRSRSNTNVSRLPTKKSKVPTLPVPGKGKETNIPSSKSNTSPSNAKIPIGSKTGSGSSNGGGDGSSSSSGSRGGRSGASEQLSRSSVSGVPDENRDRRLSSSISRPGHRQSHPSHPPPPPHTPPGLSPPLMLPTSSSSSSSVKQTADIPSKLPTHPRPRMSVRKRPPTPGACSSSSPAKSFQKSPTLSTEQYPFPNLSLPTTSGSTPTSTAKQGSSTSPSSAATSHPVGASSPVPHTKFPIPSAKSVSLSPVAGSSEAKSDLAISGNGTHPHTRPRTRTRSGKEAGLMLQFIPVVGIRSSSEPVQSSSTSGATTTRKPSKSFPSLPSTMLPTSVESVPTSTPLSRNASSTTSSRSVTPSSSTKPSPSRKPSLSSPLPPTPLLPSTPLPSKTGRQPPPAPLILGGEASSSSITAATPGTKFEGLATGGTAQSSAISVSKSSPPSSAPHRRQLSLAQYAQYPMVAAPSPHAGASANVSPSGGSGGAASSTSVPTTTSSPADSPSASSASHSQGHTQRAMMMKRLLAKPAPRSPSANLPVGYAGYPKSGAATSGSESESRLTHGKMASGSDGRKRNVASIFGMRGGGESDTAIGVSQTVVEEEEKVVVDLGKEKGKSTMSSTLSRGWKSEPERPNRAPTPASTAQSQAADRKAAKLAAKREKERQKLFMALNTVSVGQFVGVDHAVMTERDRAMSPAFSNFSYPVSPGGSAVGDQGFGAASENALSPVDEKKPEGNDAFVGKVGKEKEKKQRNVLKRRLSNATPKSSQPSPLSPHLRRPSQETANSGSTSLVRSPGGSATPSNSATYAKGQSKAARLLDIPQSNPGSRSSSKSRGGSHSGSRAPSPASLSRPSVIEMEREARKREKDTVLMHVNSLLPASTRSPRALTPAASLVEAYKAKELDKGASRRQGRDISDDESSLRIDMRRYLRSSSSARGEDENPDYLNLPSDSDLSHMGIPRISGATPAGEVVLGGGGGFDEIEKMFAGGAVRLGAKAVESDLDSDQEVRAGDTQVDDDVKVAQDNVVEPEIEGEVSPYYTVFGTSGKVVAVGGPDNSWDMYGRVGWDSKLLGSTKEAEGEKKQPPSRTLSRKVSSRWKRGVMSEDGHGDGGGSVAERMERMGRSRLRSQSRERGRGRSSSRRRKTEDDKESFMTRRPLRLSIDKFPDDLDRERLLNGSEKTSDKSNGGSGRLWKLMRKLSVSTAKDKAGDQAPPVPVIPVHVVAAKPSKNSHLTPTKQPHNSPNTPSTSSSKPLDPSTTRNPNTRSSSPISSSDHGSSSFQRNLSARSSTSSLSDLPPVPQRPVALVGIQIVNPGLIDKDEKLPTSQSQSMKSVQPPVKLVLPSRKPLEPDWSLPRSPEVELPSLSLPPRRAPKVVSSATPRPASSVDSLLESEDTEQDRAGSPIFPTFSTEEPINAFPSRRSSATQSARSKPSPTSALPSSVCAPFSNSPIDSPSSSPSARFPTTLLPPPPRPSRSAQRPASSRIRTGDVDLGMDPPLTPTKTKLRILHRTSSGGLPALHNSRSAGGPHYPTHYRRRSSSVGGEPKLTTIPSPASPVGRPLSKSSTAASPPSSIGRSTSMSVVSRPGTAGTFGSSGGPGTIVNFNMRPGTSGSNVSGITNASAMTGTSGMTFGGGGGGRQSQLQSVSMLSLTRTMSLASSASLASASDDPSQDVSASNGNLPSPSSPTLTSQRGRGRPVSSSYPRPAHQHHQRDHESQTVTFRELPDPRKKDVKPKAILSEREKMDRWDELLKKSDMAGGTLHWGVGFGNFGGGL